MKTVILAGGRGTRMGSGWNSPKPLLEIGGRPILEHVMDIYLDAGITEFVVCAGYRFNDFIRWFSHSWIECQSTSTSELRYTLRREGQILAVLLVDTGADTMTGGRLRRVKAYLNEPFFLTYADGLANVNLRALWETHRSSGAAVTVTAIPLAVQYGVVTLKPDRDLASRFEEKPVLDELWCNVGFFVVEPSVISEYCIDDSIRWEADVLSTVASTDALAVHRHDGYWTCVDYADQLRSVRETWRSAGAPWRMREGGGDAR